MNAVYRHDDGTISLFTRGALVESGALGSDMKNKFIFMSKTGNDYATVHEPVTGTKAEIFFADLALIELPQSFDTTSLSANHAPIKLTLWFGDFEVRLAYYNNITQATEDAKSYRGSLPCDFLVEVHANHHEILSEYCGEDN